MNNTREIKDVISFILSFVTILISIIIFFISSPDKINSTTISIFIGIGVLMLIISIYTKISSEWKKMRINNDKNKNEIEDIKKSLKYEKSYYDMDKRVSILEYFLNNKKGEIDPRIIFWILIAILLYLFLKSMGILP